MDDILARATELGKRIAADPTFQRLRDTENAVKADSAVQKLLEEYERQRRKMADLEAHGKPVEVADKHELQRLGDAVHATPILQELLRVQADYLDMMQKINKAIQKELQSSPATP